MKVDIFSSSPRKILGNYKLLLILILVLHLFLLSININAPFFASNEDNNAVWGLGAYNLAKFGFLKLKFGVVTAYYDSVEEIGKSFYTNHPQWFILPTALIYKLFGVSEATTRLSSIIFSLLSLAAFYFTVYLFYKDYKIALFSSLVYALLPGLIFYSRALSEVVFVVVFSNFAILSFFLLQKYQSKFLKPLFIFLIFYGGFQGWHFYFVPVALWFYSIFNRNIKERKFLLVSLPLVSMISFATNFLHFYILRGSEFTDIFRVFKSRSSRVPLLFYLRQYSFWVGKNFTWLASLIALVYLVYGLYQFVSKRKFDLPLIYLIQPLLVIIFFQQWTVHGFGPIYWAQFIALSVGLILNKLINFKEKGLLIIGSIIMTIFIFLTVSNLKFHFNSRIIGEKDIKLLKVISTKAPKDAKISLGENFIGFSYGAIAEWYLKRNIHQYNWEKDDVDLILAFNPNLGVLYQEEIKKMVKSNYQFLGCAEYLCVLQRK